MSGEPISQLNEGLRLLRDELLSDSLASKRVELAIVTFGPAKKEADWVSAVDFYPPTLTAEGNTPLGQAATLALDMIAERKETYKQNGISYYRPWVFLITDGAPTDSWKSASDRIREEESRKAVSFFCVGVQDADFGVLRALGVRDPLKLQGLKFQELFSWLSSSLGSVSMSIPGEVVELRDPTGPRGWAVLD